MSFLALGYWLIFRVQRMLRFWRNQSPPRSGLPEWTWGASVEFCLHELRFNGDEFGEGPPTVRMILHRDMQTGKIYDQGGRELVAAAIRARRDVTTFWGKLRQRVKVASVLDVHQDPDDILRVLDTHIFSGQMITFVFTDMEILRRSQTPLNRAGVTCTDATSVWIEASSGFTQVHDQVVLKFEQAVA